MALLPRIRSTHWSCWRRAISFPATEVTNEDAGEDAGAASPGGRRLRSSHADGGATEEPAPAAAAGAPQAPEFPLQLRSSGGGKG